MEVPYINTVFALVQPEYRAQAAAIHPIVTSVVLAIVLRSQVCWSFATYTGDTIKGHTNAGSAK